MKLRKILLPIASAALVATPLCVLTSCDNTVYVTEIGISSLPATYLGESPKALKFTATVTPDNATHKDVKWSIVSGGTGEATIDESTGVLTPTVAGTVKVRATSTDGKNITKDTEIKIYEIPVEQIYIWTDTENAKIGDVTEMSSFVYPSSACQNLKWEVSNPDLADITSDGKLTMKKDGIVQVICSSQDGSEIVASTNVRGYTTAASEVTFTKLPTSNTIAIGEEFQLGAKVDDAASITDIVWSVTDGDTGKACIDPNGYLVGATEGTVTVKATSGDGKAFKEQTITVSGNKYSLTPEQYISDRTISIEAGGCDSTQTYVSAEFGTGWIVADATPTISDDYRFIIAVPKTLQNRFDAKETYCKQQGYSFVYRFSARNAGDKTLINQWDNYINFTTYEKTDKYETTLGGTVPNFKVGNVEYTKGADLQLVYVSFTQAEVEKSRAVPTSLLRKLNKLNALQKAGEKITKLAHLNDDGTVNDPATPETKIDLKTLNLYTGGYPQQWRDQKPDYNNWEFDSITLGDSAEGKTKLLLNTNETKATDATATEEMAGTYHLFNQNVDVTPYLYSETNGVIERFLNTSGGAGSMVMVNLGTDETPNYQVLGMYWGTSTQRKPYGSYPHFSILNSFQKYYLKDVIDPE